MSDVTPTPQEGDVTIAHINWIDYRVAARDEQQVVDLAVRCVESGVMARIMRPWRVHKFGQLVTPVDSVELYMEEDRTDTSLYPALVGNKELAEHIVKERLFKTMTAED